MSEWRSVELEQDSDAGNAERRAALWRALEQARGVPDRAHIELLSGIEGEDLARIRRLWTSLAPTTRRQFVVLLIEVAEADFAMDFSAIYRFALSDEDARVRGAALRGLDEVEDVRLVSQYIQMLEHDLSPLVRHVAAEGLGKYVLLGELGKLRSEPFDRAVLALLSSYRDPNESSEVRQAAVESMAYAGAHGVPDVIENAYADRDEGMRRSAVTAMGRSADARWRDAVQAELLSPDPGMRLAAVRACGELQLREAVREVIDLTDDVDAETQAMALWALGQIGGTLARKTLETFIKSDDEVLAELAKEALQELEFFHGDLSAFFGPPEEFDGETDGAWHIPGLVGIPPDDDASDDDASDDDASGGDASDGEADDDRDQDDILEADDGDADDEWD